MDDMSQTTLAPRKAGAREQRDGSLLSARRSRKKRDGGFNCGVPASMTYIVVARHRTWAWLHSTGMAYRKDCIASQMRMAAVRSGACVTANLVRMAGSWQLGPWESRVIDVRIGHMRTGPWPVGSRAKGEGTRERASGVDHQLKQDRLLQCREFIIPTLGHT